MKEVIEWLKPEPGKIFVDATLGLGGHTKAILEASAPLGMVYAFDWNKESMEIAKERLKEFEGRVKYIPKNFTAINETLQRAGILVDGVLLDLGLSSFLLEGSGRGFTFQKDEPLDMRMSEEIKITAKDILKRARFEELWDILQSGEVPRAKAFAKYLIERRKYKSFETTRDLVSAVIDFYKPSPKKEKDILALVFQAFRIRVNRELENLEKALRDVPEILKVGGRFVVISYHSLEDRLVKRAFQNDVRLRVLTKKPIIPSLEEIRRNPRARSAKMRVAERRY
ncbi:MAG: 16S rRNA (cytosine(1402)-N(4))-methyltransferase RsmH [Caldimicrobium sp.]